MNEFLTENARRAYPLEHELPAAAKQLWTQLLLDACVATRRELPDGARLALMSVRRTGTTGITLQVGVTGMSGVAALSVTIGRGLADFAKVFAQSADVKAILTVSGRTADAIMADSSYGTAAVTVNVPFALRCTSGGHRRVTSVSAYSAAPCTTPVFSGHASETPARTVADDVVVMAGEGVDAEAVGMMPLKGRLLRISAIAAPAETSQADTDVDLMVRGDGCITVEAIPGAKVSGDAIVPRTADEPDGLGVMGGGVLKIGNSCKACCQCEDYKAAVDAIRDPEELAAVVKQMLDEAKDAYDAAIAAFNARKAAAVADVNDLGNVRCSAVATASEPAYIGSTASGKRARVAITLSVENMTQRTVTVTVGAFNLNDAALPVAERFSHVRTAWTKVSGGATGSGDGTPPATALRPGGTLLVAATYAKTAQSNEASKPAGMTVAVAVSSGGDAENRTVSVT